MTIAIRILTYWGVWLFGFLAAGFLLARRDWDNQLMRVSKPSSFWAVVGYGANAGEPIRGKVYNKWFVQWLLTRFGNRVTLLETKIREVRGVVE